MATVKKQFVKEQSYEFPVRWHLKEEDLHADKIITSPEFEVPNLSFVTYYLRLFPATAQSNGLSTVCFYLSKPREMLISTDVNVSNFSSRIGTGLVNEVPPSTFWGFVFTLFEDIFYPPKEVVLVDKEMTIKFDVTLAVKFYHQVQAKVTRKRAGKRKYGGRKKQFVPYIFKRTSTLCRKLMDVKLELDASAAPPTDTKIVIQNQTFDSVPEALGYCYGIQNSDTLSVQEAADILIFAGKYEIQDLKENMEEFCIEKLSASNVCLFANASASANSEKLKHVCLEFLSKRMKPRNSVKGITELNLELKEALFLQSVYH